MPEKTVILSPVWARPENEQKLMRRLTVVICGEDSQGPFKKDSGYKWQLDPANNYWASVENGKLVIAYRYDPKRLAVLAAFCELWF